MPRDVVADLQPDFAGGLNSVASAVTLAPNQMSVALNARLTQFGGVTKRRGTQRLTTNTLHANGIKGLDEWALSDGTRYLIAVANGTVYRGSYGAFPITFTSVSGALSASEHVGMAAFRDASGDALYLTDGGPLNKLTVAAGPTFTLTVNLASTPGARSIDVFNQRLWSCGCGTDPQSIFYSDLNNGDTLGDGANGGGQIIVRTFGQQNVTAVKALGTSLMIFHRGGVSRLTGFGQDDTVALPAGVTGEVGTTAAESVVRVGNIIYYVNVRGLFIATADGVAPVNTPEKPDPLSLVLPSLDEDDLANVTAVFARATRELLISVPNTGVYAYHTVLQSWSGPWTGAYTETGRQEFANVGTGDNVPVVLKGGDDGFLELVDAPNQFTDGVSAAGAAGTGYVLNVTCRRQFAGDFAMAKSYRWGYVLGDLAGSDDSLLSWQTDDSGGSTPLTQTASSFLGSEVGDDMITEGEDSIAVATSPQSLRVPVWGTGYYIDMSLQDSSTSAAPTFSRVEVTGFSLGRR